MSPRFARNGYVTALLSCLFLSFSIAQEPSSSSPQTLIDGIRFTLADGLRIEKVADEPLVKWPIVADWDPQGRLVIAESGGVGWPIQEHNKQKLHKIIRLSDTDGDGKYDKRIVAADKLAFPEGVLCLGKEILVSAPPVIWKLTDGDGDGICEKREVWFDGGTVTNCANDLHGPYLGRDGWIYWCKGAFGEQTHELLDGRTLESSAAQIYRRRLAGGPIEPIVSGGMDNPVEVTSIPEGEKFFTSTFLQHPGDGLRDGIAHAVYGSVFGKDHAVLDGLTRTGPLMPVTTQLGPAAPSGLICLDSDRLIRFSRYAKSRILSAALFNLQKLTAHQLVPRGASYQTVDHDLVVADRVDFHPTDVIEDADGSLLLIDTGGWYDLCCPTSRIDQKTAAGGIYRISSVATAAMPIDRSMVDWASVTSKDLVSLLYDSRPWIRRQASTMIQDHGNESIKPLELILKDTNRPIDDRLTALWALCRIGTDNAFKVISTQLTNSESSLVHAACHAISVQRFEQARDALETLLEHDELKIQRAAAEALGRVGDNGSRAKLIDALGRVEADRHLEHSLLYAMIEISRRDSQPIVVDAADSDSKLRASLLVLGQLGQAGELEPARLFVALNSKDPKLRLTATDILAKHPEWAALSIDDLKDLWSQVSAESEAENSLSLIIKSWKHDPSVQSLLREWISKAANLNPYKQTFLARQFADFSEQTIPKNWAQSITKWLADADENTQRELLDSLGRLEMEPTEASNLGTTITRLANQADDPERRLRLLSAVPKNRRLDDAALEATAVTAFLSDSQSLVALASKALLRIRLSDDAATRLIKALPKISSQFLTTAIESVQRTGNDALDKQLLANLSDLPTARTLPQEFLKNLYKKRSKELRELAARTGEDLVRPPADIKASVDKMLAGLGPGDPVRGLQVFRGNKAACSGCHRMGYIGKEVGPVLTQIGGSRTPEALLEAIMFPNARLEQSYQSTRVLTVDGQIYNGLIRRRSGESIELQLNAERLVVIATEDIDRLEPSSVSVMPSGMNELLSLEEISDLMALLRSAK